MSERLITHVAFAFLLPNSLIAFAMLTLAGPNPLSQASPTPQISQ